MLKSYDYFEISNSMDNDIVALTENKNKARLFLAKHADKTKPTGRNCPACWGKGAFFKKSLGIVYVKCADCGTIFADCSKNLVDEYNDEISAQLPGDSSLMHDSDDFKFWLNFRALRYLGSNYDAGKIIIYLDKLSGAFDPISVLRSLRERVSEDGILVFSLRLGTGFETLTSGFNEHNGRIFPLKYIFLPTETGLQTVLNKAGFQLIELSAIGTADVLYGKGEKQASPFLDYLINDAPQSVQNEFQRFLQSNGLSSYARGIAQ